MDKWIETGERDQETGWPIVTEYKSLLPENALFWQRYDFARKVQRWSWDYITTEIDRTANYFAPSRWTMYEPITGDQNELWENRWHDGKLWSRFLARNISRMFFCQEAHDIDECNVHGVVCLTCDGSHANCVETDWTGTEDYYAMTRKGLRNV